MTHPFHRLADTTQRMFLGLMAADPRSPLTDVQRTAAWVCLKDHAWQVGSGGPVQMAILEAWYDTIQRQWKQGIHSGDIDQNSGTT